MLALWLVGRRAVYICFKALTCASGSANSSSCGAEALWQPGSEDLQLLVTLPGCIVLVLLMRAVVLGAG